MKSSGVGPMSCRIEIARKRLFVKGVASLGLVLGLCGGGTPVFAQGEDDMKVLEMFYEEKDLVVTPTRDPKPVSQVAENVTVITAREIEALGAHTLTEVLNTIPGIHVEPRVTPGGLSGLLSIQGSASRHVRVLIDGVTVNDLPNALADVGAMPVQRIALIEVIKGPASSTWGSSLGGIINIITKSPDESRVVGGLVSALVGERTTGDFRLELSGAKEMLGYYLSADGLTSDGLQPHTSVDSGSVYGKLKWEPTDQTSIISSVGYSNGARGVGEFIQLGTKSNANFEYLFAASTLTHAINDNLDLDISGRLSRRQNSSSLKDIGTELEIIDSSFEEPGLGASAKLAWRVGLHSMNLGADYDYGKLDADEKSFDLDPIAGGLVETRKTTSSRLERWAVFANDTIVWRAITITPGLRYDWTSTNGDFLSPSLGVTLNWDDHTILRAYAARGFSIPPLSATSGSGLFLLPNPDLRVEKVWSYQTGFESTLLRYVWLKSTLFRHDISDFLGFDDDRSMVVNQGKQRRQGVEVETRTIPLFNAFISAGYTFIDASDRLTGDRLANIPRHTYDVGFHYDDRKWLKGAFTGRHVWWNAEQALNGKYSAMIWDMSLAARFVNYEKVTGEFIFTAHNVFDGSQYQDELFKNPRRWFEGGVRFKF